MLEIQQDKFEKTEALEPLELVVELFTDYAVNIEENLWAWEKERWHELVFCILTAIGEPDVLAVDIRRLTDTLSSWGLLDLDALASQNGFDSARQADNSLQITIDKFLQQAGFTNDKACISVKAICEAAASLKNKHDGKVQLYFRRYGTQMLDQISDDFEFSDFGEAREALAIWLQNTLNMPVPASNPLADLACEKLGVTYQELVEAADQADINVALLDDALRAYWEEDMAEYESKM